MNENCSQFSLMAERIPNDDEIPGPSCKAVCTTLERSHREILDLIDQGRVAKAGSAMLDVSDREFGPSCDSSCPIYWIQWW
jgi:hypothetical protein